MEIKSIYGKVLFSSEAETVAQTLKDAIKSGANLSGADLIGADLIGADLIGADLRSADLSGANLRSADIIGADLIGADLIGADLSGADLRSADLRSANLTGADLSGADLRSANLTGANLTGAKNIEQAKMPIYAKWSAGIAGCKLSIGCKTKTFEEWAIWFAGSEEYITPRNSGEFKRLYAIFLANKAYYEFMKS